VDDDRTEHDDGQADRGQPGQHPGAIEGANEDETGGAEHLGCTGESNDRQRYVVHPGADVGLEGWQRSSGLHQSGAQEDEG